MVANPWPSCWWEHDTPSDGWAVRWVVLQGLNFSVARDDRWYACCHKRATQHTEDLPIPLNWELIHVG